MSKVLVCCLGGTIGSKVTGDKTIKLGSAPDKSFFEKAKVKAGFKIITPILYSSENADITYFKEAFKGIVREVKEDRPDGILILHGTDSMAYFAQLAVRALSFLNLPVIITGAKLPPQDLRSDAQKNVKYALGIMDAAISGKTGNGTFGVVFSDSFMGDTSFVQAYKMQDPDFQGDYKKFPGGKEPKTLTEEEAMAFINSENNKRIITIPNTPGFPYDALDITKADAILIEAYHSGTASTRGLPELIKKATEEGKKCYIAPSHRNDNKYESEKVLLEAGAQPLYDMPIEGAWAEVVI